MIPEFVRPEAFLLLLAGPFLGWWHHRSIAPLNGLRRSAALALRWIVFLLLVLTLAEPRLPWPSRDRHVIIAIDRSASVGDEALEAATRFTAAADFHGATTSWLAFAGSTSFHESSEALREAPAAALDPSSTHLSQALAMARAGAPPGKVCTVLLVTDGLSSDTMPASTQAPLKIHTLPVDPPDRPETAVRSVEVPASLRPGEPVEVVATLSSNRAGRADADLFLNGVRVSTRAVELTVGDIRVGFNVRAPDERILHYEVGVRTAGDTLAENNLLGAAATGSGPTRCLMITDRPETARQLEWALRQEGITLSARPPEGAPNDWSDIQNFDAVILDNVPSSAFAPAQMEMLRDYVRAFGGGLLMLGGDQAYGLGGYTLTPVEDVLPVECDFEKDDETPSLALALVIDRSGSMEGEPIELAKAAALASARLLGPKDYISVIAFDHETHPVVPLQPAGTPGSVDAPIASITSAGGTNMAPAMEEALRQLSSSPAKLRHVILLTDGVSQEGPFFELASQMAQNRITVSTVAAGEGADRNLLAQIAQWGNGRYYESSDHRSIPQIFAKETVTASKSAIQEFPFQAQPVRAVDFLEGIPWDQSPFLLGYVRTRVKPTAETWLLTERGDPLLATWRFGLGTAAAFTSDARGRWASEWLRWSGFGKFWAQLLRRIARPSAMGAVEVRIEDASHKPTLVVEALDASGQFPDDVAATVHLGLPGGRTLDLPIPKTQPGRWETTLPEFPRGVVAGRVILESREADPLTAEFTHSTGYPPEYRIQPANRELLATLSRSTGGSDTPDPATAFRPDERSATALIELWPWLLGLALLLFVCDVTIRRWPEPSRTFKP